jgi:hypothetical protein
MALLKPTTIAPLALMGRFAVSFFQATAGLMSG